MKRVKRGVSNSSPPPFPRKNYPQKAQPYYGEIALPKNSSTPLWKANLKPQTLGLKKMGNSKLA